MNMTGRQYRRVIAQRDAIIAERDATISDLNAELDRRTAYERRLAQDLMAERARRMRDAA